MNILGNGCLRTDGQRIVDGKGKEILLKGWGLGNWLLQEGYMWKAGSPRFDRPARIEKVIEELTGETYARQFWQAYRENYVTREDIRYMAQLGYNSVRIPFNWRLFLEEEPGLVWKEEGFLLLDRCLEWCEQEGLYAFLDLHGAPGGQTGANIDDSRDNVPRLFIDEDSWEKALGLWRRMAERYEGREVVGGYDLLNEPIVPPDTGNGDFDYLIPKLKQFYEEAIALIREVDTGHMLSLEGPHWATDVQIFDRKYDDNMVLHFHRYAEMPSVKCLQKFVDAADRLQVPLWMGETGENVNEWYAALYPLAEKKNIGYNLWPWKKMDCTNSPCSIKAPEGWELILDYINRGPHPGYRKAQEILDEYLENIRLENCVLHPEVTRHVMRQIPFSMRAVDFDEYPGRGESYRSRQAYPSGYRENTGMHIVEREKKEEKKFGFDSQWERFSLILEEGEFAGYTIDGKKTAALLVEGRMDEGSLLSIMDGKGDVIRTESLKDHVFRLEENGEEERRVLIRVEKGYAEISALHFGECSEKE